MTLLAVLLRRLPRPAALLVEAVVLAVAILAIWWFWDEPAAPFRYLEI